MRGSAIVPVLAATVLAGHAVYHLAGSCSSVERAPAAAVSAATPSPRRVGCPDHGPVSDEDWNDMARALTAYFQARQPEEIAPYGRRSSNLIQHIASCQAQISGDVSDLHARTVVGREWVGAHFRKTDWGWFVLGLDGGQIR